MSTETKIQVPSYLIQKDSCINEGFSGKDFIYEYKDSGFLVNHGPSTLSGGNLHEIRNVHLETDIDFRQDFSLELCYENRSGVNALQLMGDNRSTSYTTVFLSAGSVSVSYWNTYRRKIIRYPEEKPDVDGYINALVVRKGDVLSIYQYGTLQLSINIGNKFDETKHKLIGSNFKFKRFAITPHVNLPLSLMYDNVAEASVSSSQNLFLANYKLEVLENSVLTEKVVIDIVSEGSWIYAIYSDGTMEAFSRPRGIDKGVTLETVSYDPVTETVKFVADDVEKTEYVVNVPTKPAPGIETPSGIGVLVEGNVHKDLIYGQGVELVKTRAGKNAMSFYDDPYLEIERFYITSPNKKIGGLDYSKRLNMKSVITENDERFPFFSSATGSNIGWVEFPYDATTTNTDIFKIKNGKVTLPKGDYYLRGFFNILYSHSEVCGLRITDGVNDIFSKTWNSTKGAGSVRDLTRIEISENLYLSEETEIIVEEYHYRITSRFTVPTGFSTTLVSQLEFFKL